MATDKKRHSIQTNLRRYDCEIPLGSSINKAISKVDSCKRNFLYSNNPNSIEKGHYTENFFKSMKPSSLNRNKFHTPELNTSKNYVKMIKSIETCKPKATNITIASAQEVLTTKATKKLNFPIHQSVYKNLIPININDSLIANEIYKGTTTKKPLYQPKLNKDPTPNLNDYLTPIPQLEHHLVPHERFNDVRNLTINYFNLIYNIVVDDAPGF